VFKWVVARYGRALLWETWTFIEIQTRLFPTGQVAPSYSEKSLPPRLLRLPQRQGGVSEQMVDAQKLRVGSRLRIGFLCCQNGIAQPQVIPVE